MLRTLLLEQVNLKIKFVEFLSLRINGCIEIKNLLITILQVGLQSSGTIVCGHALLLGSAKCLRLTHTCLV